jgi:hypothetical protein
MGMNNLIIGFGKRHNPRGIDKMRACFHVKCDTAPLIFSIIDEWVSSEVEANVLTCIFFEKLCKEYIN